MSMSSISDRYDIMEETEHGAKTLRCFEKIKKDYNIPEETSYIWLETALARMSNAYDYNGFRKCLTDKVTCYSEEVGKAWVAALENDEE